MPWRRPRKRVDRPVNVSRAIEETLEEISAGDDEDEAVELADVDGASIVEAATREPDPEQRTPSPFAEQPSRVELGDTPVVAPVPSAARPEESVALAGQAAPGRRPAKPRL